MAKINDIANCVIGEGSVFEGKFSVDGSIRIDGKFQGEIFTGDELTVSSTGKVKTDIIAKRVTIAGTLIGNIQASEEVSIVENGKVLGNIETPKLNLDPGVSTAGKVKISSSSGENIEQMIEQSFGEDAAQYFTKTAKSHKPQKDEPKDKEKYDTAEKQR